MGATRSLKAKETSPDRSSHLKAKQLQCNQEEHPKNRPKKKKKKKSDIPSTTQSCNIDQFITLVNTKRHKPVLTANFLLLQCSVPACLASDLL